MARTLTTLLFLTMTMRVVSADPSAKYNRNHGTLTTATTLDDVLRPSHDSDYSGPFQENF
jgi:hypothetical protein